MIFENFFKFSKRRRAVPLRPIWTIMVAAKLDRSSVLVAKVRQNRSTLKGRSAGQRHRQTDMLIAILSTSPGGGGAARNDGYAIGVHSEAPADKGHEGGRDTERLVLIDSTCQHVALDLRCADRPPPLPPHRRQY